MNRFKIIPTIEKYSTVNEMLAVESFSEKDLILASKSSYQKYFAGKTNKADVIFKGDFGNGEPTETMMDKIIETIDYKKYQRIIAIGGGGVIDMAKVLLISEGRSVEKIMEEGVLSKPKCSLIAIPTTCGSGSEMSNIAILGIEKIQSKFGLVYDEMYPNRSIIIPELLENLPDRFFLTSAIDGMIHGIESYLSPKNNSYTELFSLKGIELYVKGLNKIAEQGLEIKETLFDDFSLASNYTGTAFSNTGTGAVHAISYPLSGKYHVTHGEANALFLVEILKLYSDKNKGDKINILKNLFSKIFGCENEYAFDVLGESIEKCVELYPLKKYGMKECEIKTFSASVYENQQRLLSNSYMKIETTDLERIYERLI